MTSILLRLVVITMLLTQPLFALAGPQPDRPNILIAITDDHSWPHTSVQGSPFGKIIQIFAMLALLRWWILEFLYYIHEK